MRVWLTLLFPFAVWGFHFIGLYLAIEFMPRWSILATVLLTMICAAALAGFWSLWRRTGELTRTVAGFGTLLSFLAIAAQCLPLLASA
jgi:hypothetical protein